MKICEAIDEKGRISRIEFIAAEPTEVIQAYVYSYLHTRKQYQKMGAVMGLEREEGMPERIRKEYNWRRGAR